MGSPWGSNQCILFGKSRFNGDVDEEASEDCFENASGSMSRYTAAEQGADDDGGNSDLPEIPAHCVVLAVGDDTCGVGKYNARQRGAEYEMHGDFWCNTHSAEEEVEHRNDD